MPGSGWLQLCCAVLDLEQCTHRCVLQCREPAGTCQSGLHLNVTMQVANLEREVDWVRGELAEAQAAGDRHVKDAAARVRDADQAAARAKSQRKDELKRLAKEKAALTERVAVSLCPGHCDWSEVWDTT